jgi:hypothetical protein
LENFLTSKDANTPVRILPELAPTLAPSAGPPSVIPQSSKNLSPGATAGIVLGSAAVVLVSIAIWALRRRQAQQHKEDDLYHPMAVTDTAPADRDAGASSIGGSTDAAVASVGAAAGAATLGAKQADYGKNKGKTSVVAYDTLEAGALATSDKAGDAAEEHESSSNAGSSGWSSSAGVSSLNTGSNDDSVDPAADRGEGGAAGGIAAGSTLAAIGAASAIPRVVDKRCVIRECIRSIFLQ